MQCDGTWLRLLRCWGSAYSYRGDYHASPLNSAGAPSTAARCHNLVRLVPSHQACAQQPHLLRFLPPFADAAAGASAAAAPSAVGSRTGGSRPCRKSAAS